jgi:hypothetical protein
VWRWMYADPAVSGDSTTWGWVRCLRDTLRRQNGMSARFVEAAG